MEDSVSRSGKLAVALALLVVLFLACSCSSSPYTARVVDAETGKPVEGAVYLAIWFKTVSGKKAWFEGPSTEIAKFQEGYSNEQGWVDVPGFWTKNPLAKDRTLIVYKPGYVMWNSTYVFPDLEKRHDSMSTRREVSLEKWSGDHNYLDHEGFVDACTGGALGKTLYQDGDQLFYKHFMSYELKNH